SCSSTGLTMRQGPHQGAHKSTMTGILAASATSAKVVSSASAIHGSGSWHLPQRGVPAAAAGTRFICPQCPQRISSLAMAPLSRAGAPASFRQPLARDLEATMRSARLAVLQPCWDKSLPSDHRYSDCAGTAARALDICPVTGRGRGSRLWVTMRRFEVGGRSALVPARWRFLPRRGCGGLGVYQMPVL